MTEDNVNIQMRLISVSEVSFMMSPGKIGDDVNPDAVQIGFSTLIQPDVENDTFNLFFGTRYELDGDVVLECLYKFEFEVKNLRQFIVYNEDQSITVNHIMPHFLSVAIGTMRGILVVKTAGTNCAKYPLPMINVNQLNVNLSNKE